VLGSASALIQRDGDIVAVDGSSPVVMNVPAGNDYYVAVKHRNHLGVMTGTAVTATAGATAVVDFTTMTNGTTASAGSAGQSWGNIAQKDLTGGKFGMFAGDVNGNGSISYSGPANDRGVVLVKLNGLQASTISNIYVKEDVNLNGNVSYSGPANDRGVMLVTLNGLQASTKVQQIN
jgi:hypothetical protein